MLDVFGRYCGRHARRCAGTGGRCSVAGQKHGNTKESAFRCERRSSRDYTRPPKLSLALAMVLIMNARHFQRTHPFRGL